MREFERIERINNLIKQIWEKQPDLRYMQLIDNIVWSYSNENNGAFKNYSYSKWEDGDLIAFKKDVVNVDCFHLEDSELEEYLEVYLANI